MKPEFVSRLRPVAAALVGSAGILFGTAVAQQPPALGEQPTPAALPRVEFVFEARVTLAPATVLGETGIGHRQFIPITGGKVAGPKFNGEVLPGGWDYQLRTSGGCGSISADYFWKAADGAVIHILNEGLMCGGGAPGGARTYLVPRFEAPKGPHEWMTGATFVATLEPDRAAGPPAPGAPPSLGAIRIKFYQVK